MRLSFISAETLNKARGAARLSLWLGVAAITVVLLFARNPARADQEAMSEVKATVDQALSILKDPNYKSAVGENRQKLRGVIGAHFDFGEMARSALGVHWKELSDQQRQDFIAGFTHLLEASYLGKIESYSGQKIDYVKEVPDSAEYTQVNTNVVEEGKDPISVNYRLKLEGGTWKVYDVIIDGISLVANYRNQFNRIINSKGFDALLSEIKSKESTIQESTNQ